MSKKLRGIGVQLVGFCTGNFDSNIDTCIQGNRNNKISPDRKFEADKCTDITGNQDGIY